MEYKIAVLKGDGIGPEIVDVATKVLEKIGEKFNNKFIFTRGYLLENLLINMEYLYLMKL